MSYAAERGHFRFGVYCKIAHMGKNVTNRGYRADTAEHNPACGPGRDYAKIVIWNNMMITHGLAHETVRSVGRKR